MAPSPWGVSRRWAAACLLLPRTPSTLLPSLYFPPACITVVTSDPSGTTIVDETYYKTS